jgi:hypothetical protein
MEEDDDDELQNKKNFEERIFARKHNKLYH